ncbi:CIA30-domain-containing protein [Xylariomycetidae sp. FL2044]|nr:CIA30-domain-containing protein [Xylariomycetidae sp. FL2044]
MRATTACLWKGFVGRSLDEFKRLSNIAFKLEGIKGPSGPLPLHNFHAPERVQECKVMCDVDIGGYSKASLDWIPAANPDPSSTRSLPAHARFHGTISTALPPHKPDVHRSGFAAWRTRDRPPTIFGRALWDIDMYVYLALRIKSDGRSYFVNVQTESVVPTDLHQHRLFSKRPGEWETVVIKWNDFVRTNHGIVVEPQHEMLRQKVKSVGLGLTDRVPGPFDISIERIWATNDDTEGDHYVHPEEDLQQDDSVARHGQLRNKQGQQIHWSN